MPKTFAYSVEELDDSPRVSYGEQGVRLVRIFKLPWANHRDFVENMLGGSTSAVGSTLPDKIADYGNLEAAEAEVVNFIGNISGTANSTAESTNTGWCQVTVTYLPEDRLQNLEDGDRIGDGALENTTNPGGAPIIMEYGASFSTEVQVLTQRQVAIGNDNKKLKPDKTFVYVIPITEHSFTMYDVPSVPIAAINTLRAYSNEAFTMPVIGLACPAETTIMRGAQLTRRYTAKNFRDRQEPAWTVTIVFVQKHIPGDKGWNHVLDETGTWQSVRLRGGGKPYPTASFLPLFRF